MNGGRIVRRVGESKRDMRRRARETVANNRYVSVDLVCRRDHPGEHLAAAVHMDTGDGEDTFDEVWRRPAPYLGVWQDAEHVARTVVHTAPDGHRVVEATCPTCQRPVQIREDRLRALLAGMWAPSAWNTAQWPPA